MLPEEVGGPCSCRCHTGVSLFHVVWRPCCDKPIQGGTQMLVWALPKHDPQYMIIGMNEVDAVDNYKMVFDPEDCK